MTTLPFTNKTEYLAWRTQWRADYKALSENIRKLKKDRKDKDAAIRCAGQYKSVYASRKAAEMMEIRKQSKLQAQAQYQAAKAAAVPAQV